MYAQFTVLPPYPETPLFDYAQEHNLIEDWNREHYTTIRLVMRRFYFTRKQLGKMLRYAYRKFYMRFGFIKEEIKAGRFKDVFLIVLKEAFNRIKEKFR